MALGREASARSKIAPAAMSNDRPKMLLCKSTWKNPCIFTAYFTVNSWGERSRTGLQVGVE
jgi:hypothetical protein